MASFANTDISPAPNAVAINVATGQTVEAATASSGRPTSVARGLNCAAAGTVRVTMRGANETAASGSTPAYTELYMNPGVNGGIEFVGVVAGGSLTTGVKVLWGQ